MLSRCTEIKDRLSDGDGADNADGGVLRVADGGGMENSSKRGSSDWEDEDARKMRTR
jgi:hypothetical protein